MFRKSVVLSTFFLGFNLQILAQAPSWNINPANYEYSMSITSIVLISGIPSSNENTILGAFSGEECRGLATPIFALDKWLFFLTVYSNLEGEIIDFKTFNADNATVLTVSEDLAFEANGILGDPISPFEFHSIVDTSGIPTEGLLAHYPFRGNAKDNSGYGNHGTVVGSALSADRLGIVDRAYSFDGLNDYIDLGNPQSLNLTGQMAISAWINKTGPGGMHPGIVSKFRYNTGDLRSYSIHLGSGISPRFLVITDGTSGTQVQVTGDAIIDSIWYHIVATYDGQFLKLYQNGSLIDSINYSDGIFQSDEPVYIGVYNGTDYFFNGIIDDIRIYNRPLSFGEVYSLYTEGPPFNPINLNATPGNHQIVLTWSANSETDMSHYIIYRGMVSGFDTTEAEAHVVFRPDTIATITGLNNDVTYYFVVVAVDSTANYSIASAEVSGIPFNDPPVITSPENVVAMEDLYFVYKATATDPEDSTITFTFDQLPSWLSANADSVFGTPLEGAVDTSFRVIASDGILTDTLVVTLDVIAVNDPPEPFALLAPVDGDTAVIINDSLVFIWESATDVDSDSLVYIFHLFGPDLDTSIAGLPDTSVTLTGVDRLTIDSLYTWFVEVTDGETTTASSATFGFYVSPVLTLDPLAVLPVAYALHQNYPNPFNPITTIQFDLPVATEVHLAVYDLLGREVTNLSNRHLEPGFHQVVWDTKDNRGRKLPTGMYIVLLATPEFRKSIKVVLLK